MFVLEFTLLQISSKCFIWRENITIAKLWNLQITLSFSDIIEYLRVFSSLLFVFFHNLSIFYLYLSHYIISPQNFLTSPPHNSTAEGPKFLLSLGLEIMQIKTLREKELHLCKNRSENRNILQTDTIKILKLILKKNLFTKMKYLQLLST